jgi:molybdopterin-guanine dinucleotide biosynthesis protein A
MLLKNRHGSFYASIIAPPSPATYVAPSCSLGGERLARMLHTWTTKMASFSAALLVGGQSKRMGRDKALLEVSSEGRLLWQQQLDVLRQLGGEELFWSGPARPNFPTDLRIVADTVHNAGSLAGISACLNLLRSDLLVVLAIDLTQMTALFLRRLLAACTSHCGAVMTNGSYFEPMAAIYPKAMRTLAATHLAQGRYALQDLLQEAQSKAMIHSIPLSEKDRTYFKNANHPGDL